LAAVVPPGGTCGGKPCWKALAGGGYRNKDHRGDADGVIALKLMASTFGEARVLMKGRGMHLVTPAVDLVLPVTVQLVVADGSTTTCWQAVFTVAAKNDAHQFRATSP
jgi:hypothetical protein